MEKNGLIQNSITVILTAYLCIYTYMVTTISVDMGSTEKPSSNKPWGTEKTK